ncbi:MAG: thiolase family protein [Jiangellaceae bacterium]
MKEPDNPLGGQALITGLGQSQIGRRLGRTGLELTVEACVRAISDAGLDARDVDGVASYPGSHADPGFSGATTHQLRDALGLRTNWVMGSSETAGQLGPIMDACTAVATRRAAHVLCFRSVWESTAQIGGRATAYRTPPGGRPRRADSMREWTAPYGAPSAANWIAMLAQRYMHEHGLTREQLAQIALNGRRNAALNPNAVYRDPLTLDDYLAARMISDPFCLYDCDAPCDGATAVVVSRRDAVTTSERPPLVVEALGSALYERHTWDQRVDLTTMGAHDAAHQMWQQTRLRPADVDVAELYDGFSYLTLQWIEALGFCPHGRAGDFVEGGDRIGLDGELPVNTQGGQLSGGRLHGLGFLHEACVQLRGEAGERQVSREPTVAAVGAGGGPVAGCMLVRRAL